MTFTPLSPSALYKCCDLSALAFTRTSELAPLPDLLGQERAEEALALALAMPGDGYNVFVMGQEGAGKHTLVRRVVAEHAKGEPVPADLCYVHRFDNPHEPRALLLPAGRGRNLRSDMGQLVVALHLSIRAAFDSDDYRSRKQVLEHQAEQRGQAALESIAKDAREKNLAFMRTPVGFAFAPTREGEVISPDVFNKLPSEEQDKVKVNIAEMEEKLSDVLAQVPRLQREVHEHILALDREVTEFAVRALFEEVIAKYANVPRTVAWLESVRADVVEHAEAFLSAEEGQQHSSALALALGESEPQRWPARRYAVNLLVDRAEQEGAPVVYEDHPTLDRLVGRIEHRAQLGNLVTDFTMIQGGALHLANGGYLLLDARKLLQQPQAYDAVKRAVRSRQVRVESLAETIGLSPAGGINPESVPLEVKVTLLGDRLLYYLLCANDPEFGQLFKVVADFSDDILRTAESEQLFARMLASMVEKAGLRALDRAAVARVIEHAARLADDGGRLSMQAQFLLDLLREADYFARKAQCELVTSAHVNQAIAARERRVGRLRDESLRMLGEGTQLLSATGKIVGQINALSVLDLGGFAFGRPTRVTCRVRIGRGELIDIEREVRLGGPLHSKGVLILGSFLGARYAKDSALGLAASLVFEQSYGGVDGDSASLAELCVLISAIADAPIDQRFAVTGSVNQMGDVQAIGGVNEKIEGFFDACSALGLSGAQAVIIPESNVRHLMLRPDVVTAVEAGKFAVYAVRHVDEALALLTGLDANGERADGTFPDGGLHQQVEARLRALAERAKHLANIAYERRVEVNVPGGAPDPGMPGPGKDSHGDGR